MQRLIDRGLRPSQQHHLLATGRRCAPFMLPLRWSAIGIGTLSLWATGEAQIFPPWLMIDCRSRPMPMPRALVVNSGLKRRSALADQSPPLSWIETWTPPRSVAFDFIDSTRGLSAHGLDGVHHEVHDDPLNLTLLPKTDGRFWLRCTWVSTPYLRRSK